MKLDLEKLHLDWANAEDRESMKALARAPDQEEHTMNELQGIWDSDRSYAIEGAKELESRGAGKFIVGRKGSKSRFKWFYSSSDVARAALGELSAEHFTETKGKVLADHEITYTWEQVIELIASKEGVYPKNVLIDAKVGALRENLRRVHKIDLEEVRISIGY